MVYNNLTKREDEEEDRRAQNNYTMNFFKKTNSYNYAEKNQLSIGNFKIFK